MLIDEAKIVVTSGNGGDGRVAFFPNRGKPCGGDGGNGGNVFAFVDKELTSLFRYSRKKEYKASEGGVGGTFAKAGSAAEDLFLPFPEGTQLVDLATGDMIELKSSEPVLLCKGGHGGFGNTKISLRRQGVFMTALPGRRGQKREFQVTMRLIADCGFIGLPNAGKSSLLNALTNAGAKVAAYPFTTINPNLGVIQLLHQELGEGIMKDKIILADIPGLIEGASDGKGLGVKFLKHVEKVSFFVHCVSFESTDIKGDYEKVRTELGDYNKSLLDKPEIILVTKSDLVDEKRKSEVKKMIEEWGKKAYFCSIIVDDELKRVRDLIVANIQA